MSYQSIIVDEDAGVLTVTLNRPDRLNAFTVEMAYELIAAIDHADADDNIRAIILTGAGRGFCSGADMSGGSNTFDFAKRGGPSPVRPDGSIDWASAAIRDNGGRLTLRMLRSLKPIIAAINGPAVGIGATMTLAADIRLISTDARLGFIFTRRGIVPEALSTYLLPRLVGPSRALEWMLTGRMLTAKEAVDGGLARSEHCRETLLVEATSLARDIADNTAPVSVALTRQMIWSGIAAAHPFEAHRIESRAMFARGRSNDAREGALSFVEKRAPRYVDRVSSDMPEFYPWWEEPQFS